MLRNCFISLCFVVAGSFPGYFVRKVTAYRHAIHGFKNYESYITELAEISVEMAPELLSKLIFKLQSKDFEKELALALVQKEKENEKVVALLLKEKEKELALLEKDNELAITRSFYFEKVSAVTQRVYLEKFFRLFHERLTLKDKDGADNELCEIVKKELAGNINNLKKVLSSNPSMTSLNIALLNINIQKTFFGLEKFPDTTVFPHSLSKEPSLMYGNLSDFIHNPGFKSIIYSDETEEEVKFFLEALASYYGVKTVQFNAMQALAGKNIENI